MAESSIDHSGVLVGVYAALLQHTNVGAADCRVDVKRSCELVCAGSLD
jgi:hypothetical protein